jgi:hypothetical protein
LHEKILQIRPTAAYVPQGLRLYSPFIAAAGRMGRESGGRDVFFLVEGMGDYFMWLNGEYSVGGEMMGIIKWLSGNGE